MINKLYKLEKYIPNDKIRIDEFGLETEGRKENILILEFTTENQTDGIVFKLSGSHQEEYDIMKNLNKIYFKSKKGNSVSEFLSLFISDADIKDSAGNYSRESKTYNKILRISANNVEKNPALKNLDHFFNNNWQEIIDEISKYSKNEKGLFILSISIDGKYIGESEYFIPIKNDLLKAPLKDYFIHHDIEYVYNNKFCSLCKMQSDEIWGFVSTFNFYAAKTDISRIACGFKVEDSYKNYPVCPSCANKLNRARYFLDKSMSFKFCGFDYYIIPEFIKEDKANTDILSIFYKEKVGHFSLEEKKKRAITQSENDILEELTFSDNMVNYTLFFYEKNNSEFKIMLSIDEIFPSRFREIFSAKSKSENFALFKNLKGIYEKDKTEDLKFHFEIIKEFFPIKSKLLGDFTKSFLEIIRSVFLLKKLNYNFLLHRIMAIIQNRFSNEQFIPYTLLKAILFLKFLDNLNILDKPKININKEAPVDAKYQDFFIEHLDFFNSNIKKAIFLEGVLCQHLLDIQAMDKGGATPFRSKLNSLKLNQKLIKKLLPEIIEKLEQYDKNYYRRLEEAISTLFIDSDFNISDDEISFFFVMGMSLNKIFKDKKEEDKSHD